MVLNQIHIYNSGNGLKEQYELCDDGNSIGADGCT